MLLCYYTIKSIMFFCYYVYKHVFVLFCLKNQAVLLAVLLFLFKFAKYLY